MKYNDAQKGRSLIK